MSCTHLVTSFRTLITPSAPVTSVTCTSAPRSSYARPSHIIPLPPSPHSTHDSLTQTHTTSISLIYLSRCRQYYYPDLFYHYLPYLSLPFGKQMKNASISSYFELNMLDWLGAQSQASTSSLKMMEIEALRTIKPEGLDLLVYCN